MSDPAVRNFLLCHSVRYDSDLSRAPYSIENVLYRHRIDDDESFPFVLAEVWFYVRLEGEGSHDFRVEVSPTPGDGDDPADPLGSYGPYRVHFGRTRVGLSRAWRVRGVPIPSSGPYTFRFLQADEVLAEQHILLED